MLSYARVSPWAGACVLSFVLGVVAIGWPALQNSGFPLDDSWIHQVVGRNAAMYGIPGFNPGVASSGSTSVIWPWIIAVNYRFLPWVGPVTYLLIFNSLCLALILILLFLMSRRDGLPPLERALLAGLPALTGNCVWLISSGMEHLLFVAAVFAAAFFWVPRQSPAARSASLAAGVCCGLAILTRPEAVLLLPVFLLVAWPLRKSTTDILGLLIPCAAAMALVALNNLWSSHALFPVTFSGRKWLLYGGEPAAISLRMALGFVRKCSHHVVQFVLGLDAGQTGLRVLVPLVAGIVLLGIVRLLRHEAWRMLFLVMLTLINFSAYSVMLPALGHAMRYQAMALFFTFPLVALGALEIVERAAMRFEMDDRSRKACGRAVAGAVTALALASLINWNEITEAGIKHINGTHVRMGKWLAAHVPAGTTIASLDIGGIGYFSGDRLVDLGGLTDAGLLPYLYTRQMSVYLKERGVRWMVVPMVPEEDKSAPEGSCDGVWMFMALCDLTKREVISFTTSWDVWERGVRATDHAARRQALYEITWGS